DFTGNTGPLIQYTHVRIRSIIRKAQDEKGVNLETLRLDLSSKLNSKELDIIRVLYQYPAIVDQAGKTFSPALIANYVYDLAKSFNAFYQEIQILREEDQALMRMRIGIASFVGNTIKSGMELLGITVPERM
ncbi:MAG TPA: arginine--tRNA ligase, partial [Bacteroidales bacterium]|nr:arginine--tRNA ligase [Bacteroidales bacterium]